MSVARRRVLLLVALAFVVAAMFHAAALAWPSIAERSPPRRHALFVLVNAALAFGVVYRPRGFVILYALFTAQQVISHGTSGWLAWSRDHHVDWASAVTLIFVPLVLVLLLRDERSRGDSNSW